MTKARDIASAAPAPAGVTSTELGYVDGVTSAIQTQINTKADSSGAVTLTGTQTLTNKTIDTASNTITGAVTLTGTQTLTNKTLTTPVISSISNTGTVTLPTATDTLVGRATTDTLTNKTLTAPTINGALENNAIFRSPEERWTVSAIAATGTINFDALTQGALYYTTNASANWTLNVRGDGSNTLNSILATGDAITISFLVAQGGTAFRHTALTIDGNAQTVVWSGGTAPASGNTSGIDAYSFTIIKTAATPTYTVLGAGPIKYA